MSGPPPGAVVRSIGPEPARCRYLDACDCHGPRGPVCLHTAHGPARGNPSDRGWHVTADDCRGCPAFAPR